MAGECGGRGTSHFRGDMANVVAETWPGSAPSLPT